MDNQSFSFPVVVVVVPNGNSDEFEFGCTTNSPADHLFSNGRLLPHVFPVQRHQQTNYHSSLSRASSISSKGSLVSSRSNSTNSARTSTSEGSSSEKRISSKERISATNQKWQLIAAAPVLKHRAGSRSKADRKTSRGAEEGAKTSWFGKRILRSFVSACKECHAITP